MNEPTEPGTYMLANPVVFGEHKFEMEVYRSKLGHLRARSVEGVKLRGKFQGKKVNTFGEGWSWSIAK